MPQDELVSIGTISKDLGVSPSYIRQLADTGVLPSVRTEGGHRRFDRVAVTVAWVAWRGSASPTRTARVVAPSLELELELDGLQEDRVWSDLVPTLDVGANATAILRYAFTEMLNNAIDHSAGREATVRVWTGPTIVVEIIDDGIGVFERVARGFELPDHFAAIQELTKGKRTTAPTGHAGEGIFFTSKAVDEFHLAANAKSWTVDNLRNDHAVGVSEVIQGTTVRMKLDAQTRRDLAALFDEFTDDQQRFTRSRPVVRLFEIGVSFVSRSEAKRLLAGMERFRVVEVDFAGVESVGQGFVDELLRVWPAAHPETSIEPTNMNDAVKFMVTRGLPD